MSTHADIANALFRHDHLYEDWDNIWADEREVDRIVNSMILVSDNGKMGFLCVTSVPA